MFGMVCWGACGSTAPPTGFVEPAVRQRGFGGDTVVERAPGGTQPAWPSAQGGTLFLDFGGELISQSSTDDATRNHSVIAGNQFPPFNGAVNAPTVTQQEAEDAVTDRLRSYYADFNLNVVTTRPSTGTYTMVVVGGNHALAGQPSGVAGVSPLDCTNSNPSNVVFDFSDDQTPDYGGVVAVAATAGHEAGHSFGLEHTDNPADVMYSVMNPAQTIQNLFTLSFTTGNFSPFNAGSSEPSAETCGRANPLDNHAILASALGLSSRTDVTPPVMTWSFPMAIPVTPTFPVNVTASDNVSVKRIEIYKNLELVSVLHAPPYTAMITAASGESFYLTVEAMDDAANRVSITRPFVADSKNPPLCPDPGDCPTGRTCVNGLCRLPLGQPCSASVDCTTGFCKMLPGDSGESCTAVCSATVPCPENGMCVGGLCKPSATPPPLPKNNGDACGAGAECASGRCSSVCVPACDDTTACDDPTAACMPVDGGMGCIAGAGMPVTNASGCGVTGRAPSVPLALFALFAFAIVALRRRPRSR